MAVAFVLGSSFYMAERMHDVWFLDQAFPFHGQDMFNTKVGDTVRLPIIYLDGSLVGAFYLVDPKVAQSLLPKSMEPLTLPWPISKAIAGVFMFEYRNTSLGSYDEAGLTIQAKKLGSSVGLVHFMCDMIANMYHVDMLLSLCGESNDTGLYVSTLPVTTSEAKDAGKEIWGYNKYVSTMKTNFEESTFMTFKVGSEFTFELDSNGGSFLPTFTTAGLPFLTYTEHSDLGSSSSDSSDSDSSDSSRKSEKKIMRTKVHVGHKNIWGGASKLEIIGKGPTANRMKQLKLDTLSPVAVFRTDKLLAHLPRGVYVE